MKHIITVIAFILLLHMPLAADPLHVVVTYPYIGDLVERIGGDNVTVFVLARGDYNPHIIIPRPSFIAQVRRADLVIINGAQLEIGWMPPLLRQANNPSVQPGEPGFLDLSGSVNLIDKPESVSREKGDIHPDGNPHFYLDPENIPLIAEAISGRLTQLDPDNAARYGARLSSFRETWSAKLAEWSAAMKPLSGTPVIEYHKIFDYFLHRYNITLAGTVEPLPGIPPTSRHMEQLESLLKTRPVHLVLQDVYNPADASKLLAETFGLRLTVLPHDVGATGEATSIVSLFDDMVRRMSE